MSSRLFVLSVGVEEYERTRFSALGSLPNLPTAAADAREFARHFSEAAERSRLPYKALKISVLSDSAEVSKEGIINGLRTLAESTSPDDVVVIFLAGHGFLPSDEQMMYFLPRVEPLASAFDSIPEKESGISAMELAQELRRIPAGRVLLLIDACFSGGSIDSIVRVAESKYAASRKEVGDQSYAGTYVVVSASSTQRAAALKATGMSVFSEAISGALKSPQRITGSSLLELLRSSLPAISKKRGAAQTPLYWAEGDDFVLLEKTIEE